MTDSSDYPETITVARKTGVSKSGDPTYGAPFTMAARVENASQRQVGAEGDSLDDMTTLYTQAAILKSDLVWFPGDDTSKNDAGHRVVQVATEKDIDGNIDHYEARF